MSKLLFILTLASRLAFASPDWYGQKQGDETLIYGYGKAPSYQQAKSLAYGDLASQIEVRVTKNVQSQKLVSEGKLTVTAKSESKTQSDIVFRNNVTVTASELLDGNYYVAVQYDKTSFQQRLGAWLALGECQTEIPNYWQQVSLVTNWISQHQCLPSITIERFAGGWQLSHEKGQLILPDTQYDNLFFNYGSNAISLNSTQNRLKHGEYYFVNLGTSAAGHLSLFQVYKDGSTGVLIENKPVSADFTTTYPDSNQYDGIEAVLPTAESDTFDVNIALLCPHKIDTTRFEKLDVSPLSQDKPGFSLLLEYAQQCKTKMERLSITQ